MLKGLIIVGLFALLVVFVINAIRKALGHFSSNNQARNYAEHKAQNETQNQMIPCKQCGTYIDMQDSFSHRGAHFCSKECLDLSLSQK